MPIFFRGYRTFSHAAPAERLSTVSSPFMVIRSFIYVSVTDILFSICPPIFRFFFLVFFVSRSGASNEPTPSSATLAYKWTMNSATWICCHNHWFYMTSISATKNFWHHWMNLRGELNFFVLQTKRKYIVILQNRFQPIVRISFPNQRSNVNWKTTF